MEERSDILVASRVCLRYSTGLMTTMTAAVRMAKIPMTINNSTRVKEWLFCISFMSFTIIAITNYQLLMPDYYLLVTIY